MKECTTCRKLKDEREFINDKGKVVKKCIKCREYRKEHYNRHKDRVKEQVKEYYERNKEQIKEYSKEYRVRNREYKKEYMKEYNKEYYERNKEYFKEYYARNREQIKEYGKEYGKEYRERNKVRVKEYDKEYRKSSAKYETYAHKLTVEESPKKGKRGELLARCTKCGKYFAPTRQEVRDRIRALEGKACGECRLYCSQECRYTCEIYGVKNDPYAKHASVERDPQWAKMVKERAKFTCERCGSTSELEAHHEIPVKVNHELVNDEMNGICLCHECHMKAHSESGCTLVDLRKI